MGYNFEKYTERYDVSSFNKTAKAASYGFDVDDDTKAEIKKAKYPFGVNISTAQKGEITYDKVDKNGNVIKTNLTDEDIKKFYNKEIAPDRQEELQNYILEGGFPRTILLENMAAKRRYVQSVIDEIFEKDIRRRIKIRNKSTFETVQKYIINNFGANTSLKSLKKAIEQNGTPISEVTIARYIKALLDAKILYECPRFDMKSKKSLSGEKKYYLADTRFYFVQNTDNRINYGPVLENITYIYARSHDYSVSVGRIGKLECDFILRNNEMNYSYVQVSYTIALSKETEDREYRPLELIKDNYPKYVVTVDSLLQQRNGIKHINLVDFMRKGKDF